MTTTKKEILPWIEVVARDKATIERICTDENFAYYFIYVVCEPLLRKIHWSVLGKEGDFEELADELYLHLKKPNKAGEYWHNLRTFDFRTTLFDWIKTVALRLFLKKKQSKFHIPNVLVDNGIIDSVCLNLDKAIDRKLLKLYVIDGLSKEDVCEIIQIDTNAFDKLYISLLNRVAEIVKRDHQEYYCLMLPEEQSNNNSEASSEISYISLENKIDLQNYISLMPNKRYQIIIQNLYLEEKPPEVLAEELNTPVSNIYNLKLRALDQLRDVVILTGDHPDAKKHIFKLSSDRLRNFATSLLVKGKSYEEVASEFNLSNKEFVQLKKEMLSELKKHIYRKNS